MKCLNTLVLFKNIYNLYNYDYFIQFFICLILYKAKLLYTFLNKNSQIVRKIIMPQQPAN